MKFPTSLRLEPTNERRYPKDGEYYCWYDARHDVVRGPMLHIQESNLSWMSDEKDYMIYREVSNVNFHGCITCGKWWTDLNHKYEWCPHCGSVHLQVLG
jgi:hypothetical protein